ncbi:MAG TPA: hypothetical protein GX707_00150, partial [Epulopiscium sp.]|nr:hypothetical protein [Candidatus Epulonipiscium sp.]
HITLEGGNIIDKKVVDMPGEDSPGSKPGAKIEFKRPKGLNGFEFGEITNGENIKASLDIENAINKPIQLKFDLGDGLDITAPGNNGKKMKYEDKTYKLYLAGDDKIDGVEQNDIIKWDALEGSLIFNEVKLSLKRKETTGSEQALGIFRPIEKDKNGDIGRYTYLKYTIKRSSLQDAYIEIHPYRTAENTDFTYSVQVAGDGSNWETLVEHKYKTTNINDYTPITIPVPFSETYQQRSYKIVVKYSQGTINSQEIRYNPQEDLTIPPPTPLIQEIDNIYVVPPIEQRGNPETIGFDLMWSAPRNSSDNKLLDGLLEKGNLYYELVLYDTPEAHKGTGTLIKVFKVSKDDLPDSQIQVEPYMGTAGKKDAEGKDLPGIYNPTKNTFKMENIVLKNLESEQDGWEQIIDMPTDYDNTETINRYPEKDDPTVNDKLVDKEVPGIYYLTMRGLYEPKVTTGPAITMGISNESNPKSITISPLKEVIPVPTKMESSQLLEEEDLDIISQSFSWGNVDLTRYIKQMLDPLNLFIGEGKERTYEVYLYQKKNIQEAELTSVTTSSAIEFELPRTYKLDDKNIEDLRNNEVIRIDYKSSINAEMNNIVFEGLDANQVYYTKIRVRLDLKDKDNQAIESRHSVFSKEHSFTTYVKPSEPGPGERVPPVPEDLTVLDQPNNTTVTIGWKGPNYNTQEGERLYYEIVRVDSRKLAKEEDSRLIPAEKLIDGDTKDEMAAWRTKDTFMDQYESGVWTNVDPEQLSSKLQLEDEGLSPNKIYYYYVRTVLFVEEQEVYSSWVGIPVTTDPIQKPIMLKVENTEAYTHDPKREIVISFLAPIPKGSNIPGEYDFDIAVQGELDEDYRLDYSTTRLTSKEDDKDIPTGYDHFVYIIKNAKPGKRYDLKVRVIDKVVDMVNGQYPKSLYSDRVTTRTHFDQDEQDKEDKFAEYLKYYEDKVEALRRRPFWTLEDGPNEFTIKYRSNYIIPAINNTKAYPLAVREDVTDFTYYMPASVIASTNLNQTSFEIKQGSVTYSVRPSTITTELEELKAALEDISAKRIRDYYVAFYFRQVPQTANLGVDGFLTPKIIVDIELVTLKEEDLFLEDD